MATRRGESRHNDGNTVWYHVTNAAVTMATANEVHAVYNVCPSLAESMT